MELLWNCMIISLQGMLGTVLWAFVIVLMLAIVGGSLDIFSNINYNRRKPKEKKGFEKIPKPSKKWQDEAIVIEGGHDNNKE